MTQDQVKLKPCPFCGSVDIRKRLDKYTDNNFYASLVCRECKAEALEDVWNQRTPAIDVCSQRYLSCSSMMPSKKEVGEMRYGGCNPDEDRGYNEAIEACTLAKLKEDERKEAEFEKKLEEVLTDVFAKSQLERFSKLQQIKIILTAVKERLR